jgi:hypothetical protein
MEIITDFLTMIYETNQDHQDHHHLITSFSYLYLYFDFNFTWFIQVDSICSFLNLIDLINYY